MSPKVKYENNILVTIFRPHKPLLPAAKAALALFNFCGEHTYSASHLYSVACLLERSAALQ